MLEFLEGCLILFAIYVFPWMFIADVLNKATQKPTGSNASTADETPSSEREVNFITRWLGTRHFNHYLRKYRVQIEQNDRNIEFLRGYLRQCEEWKSQATYPGSGTALVFWRLEIERVKQAIAKLEPESRDNPRA